MIRVGIEVSKEKSMVCIRKPYGEIVVSPYEIVHKERKVSELIALVEALTGDVRVVMGSDRRLSPPAT